MTDHDRVLAACLAAIFAFCALLLARGPSRPPPERHVAYPAYCANPSGFPQFVPCAWLNPERRT